MEDDNVITSTDEPVESGALEGESGEGERRPAESQQQPAESGALEEDE